MAWTRGAVIGDRYRLDQKVGAGGMGEVWAAEHIGVGTKVAMKTLLKASATKHEMIARFKREAYFLGRIRSDHVARVLDFISDERWGHVLVMEFVEGEKLDVYLQRAKKLSVEETIEIGADLASALCDLHGANVIHRDLKPANVILRPTVGGGRRATIVDFGLSRLLTEEEAGHDTDEDITGITAANMALGTVEYMAPEQVLNSRDVTAASDLYALGALLYRAVGGRHVFGDLREGHLAHAKITRDPPKLDLERADRIARGLESVITHALMRRPADRYDRADLMLAELSSLRDLMRLSTLEIDNPDTEDSLPDVRTTLRLPVESPAQDAAEASGGGFELDDPPSTDAVTKRFMREDSRASTLRLALAPTEPSPDKARLGMTDPMPTRRVEPARAQDEPGPRRALPVPSEPEVRAPPPDPRGVSLSLAVTAAIGTLIGGIAIGRLTASPTAGASENAATAAAPVENAVVVITPSAAPSATAVAAPPLPAPVVASVAPPVVASVAPPSVAPPRPAAPWPGAARPPTTPVAAPPPAPGETPPLRGKLPTRADDPYQ